MNWALMVLMFVLGYVTCKMLYFLKSTRASVLLLRASQLVSVGLLAKAMEDFYYAKTYRMEKMIESGASDHNVMAFSYLMEEEIAHYKKRSIRGLIELHPEFFQSTVEFEDWESAMRFLNNHREVVDRFFKRDV